MFYNSSNLHELWWLGVLHILDHKVVPCSFDICDLLLNLSRDHFGIHQEKWVRVTMELEVPKWVISRPTLSTVMVQRVSQWDMQKRSSRCKCQGTVSEKYCFYVYIQIFPWSRGKKGRRRGDGLWILMRAWSLTTRRKIIHYNHMLWLSHYNSWWENTNK